MFDPTTIEVLEQTTVHMKDANKAKLYEPKLPDPAAKPVEITLWGPGSQQFQAAADARVQRRVARNKKVGDSPLSSDEVRDENITFLLDVTAGCSPNLAAPEDANRAFFEKIYRNPKLGFWFEQLNDELKDWGNFTASSQTA